MVKYRDLMIDVETLSTANNACIVQVAFAFFDPITGLVHDPQKLNIDAKSCEAVGGSLDVDTVLWWFNQPDEIRKGITGNEKSIYQFINKLSDYVVVMFGSLEVARKTMKVWANSPQFDLSILKFYLKQFDYPDNHLWSFWNELDVRTVNDTLKRMGVRKPTRTGREHDPLSDILYQIERVHQLYKNIA